MTENRHTKQFLKEMQNLPLHRKIGITQARIIEWYKHFDGQVYVSFSGGKDSTVLLDIARKLFPDIEAVFVDTGLEYPEIRNFVKTFDNVTWLKPKMRFDEVVKKYGWNFPSKELALAVYYARKGSRWAVNLFEGKNTDGTDSQFKKVRYVKWKFLLEAPFIISSECCKIMKENPLDSYGKETNKKTIIGTLAEESQRRTDSWLKTGCNAFDSKKQHSTPISFWTEQDILQYIKIFNISYASVYGDIIQSGNNLILTGEQRTGCIFCPVGCHLDKVNKFQRMAKTHPRQYDYCMKDIENGGLGLGKVLDFLKIDYKPIYDLFDYQKEIVNL